MEKEEKPLNEKNKAFIREYLVDLNASAAARRAGYSKDSAGVIGYELLKKPQIQSALRMAMDKRAERTEITADRALKELARIAFSNISDFVEFSDGEVVIKDSSSMNEDELRCIAEVSDAEFKGERKRTFKLYDKVKAIDMVLRHLGLYIDKSEIDLKGKVDFSSILKKIRDAKSNGDK